MAEFSTAGSGQIEQGCARLRRRLPVGCPGPALEVPRAHARLLTPGAPIKEIRPATGRARSIVRRRRPDYPARSHRVHGRPTRLVMRGYRPDSDVVSTYG